MNDIQAVCYGEVLIDIFPNHKKIGGAPLNVAVWLNALGLETAIISRVGNDENGKEILDYLKSRGVNTGHIAVSDAELTGIVNVTLSSDGSASYEITKRVAWDSIQSDTGILDSVNEARVFVYGSLSSREEVSRQTLMELLEKANFKVLDLNLRPPFYSEDLILNLIENADFVKLNHEELEIVAGILHAPSKDLEGQLLYLSKRFSDKTFCVTRAENGAVLHKDGTLYSNAGYQVEVQDTVGAGDSFLATLIYHLMNDEDCQKSLDQACAVGAFVATQKGATPEINYRRIEELMLDTQKQ